MSSLPASTRTVDISILIVCYKSRDLILGCLRGVYEHTRGCTFEVLLVDCSNDGAVALAQTEFPGVCAVQNDENLGYGRGNNLLAERASGRYLLLLNPDVIVTDNAVGELFAAASSQPRTGAVGGRTQLANGKRDPGCRQVIPTLFRLAVTAAGGGRFLQGGLPEHATEVSEVETLSGAFMLVRADAWHQMQGFDTSYFMYSEELDLCYRLRANGWGIAMTPRAEVIHLVGSGNSHSPKRIELLTTGRMHFLRKYWSRPKVLLGGGVLWTHALLRVMVGMLGSPLIGQEKARTLWNAYYGIVFQPRTWWYGFRELSR